jgi:hypothetical protein
MNPSFLLRRRPQENRENVEESEILEPKNATLGEKLTLGILKTFVRNGTVTGLQRGKKGGTEKICPPCMVELAGFEPASVSHLRADLHV